MFDVNLTARSRQEVLITNTTTKYSEPVLKSSELDGNEMTLVGNFFPRVQIRFEFRLSWRESRGRKTLSGQRTGTALLTLRRWKMCTPTWMGRLAGKIPSRRRIVSPFLPWYINLVFAFPMPWPCAHCMMMMEDVHVRGSRVGMLPPENTSQIGVWYFHASVVLCNEGAACAHGGISWPELFLKLLRHRGDDAEWQGFHLCLCCNYPQ